MKITKIINNFIKKIAMENTKVVIEKLDSTKTPQALGPYSKATRVDFGDKYMIFSSGSIGNDYKTGLLVGDDVQSQTKRSLENLQNLLE